MNEQVHRHETELGIFHFQLSYYQEYFHVLLFPSLLMIDNLQYYAEGQAFRKGNTDWEFSALNVHLIGDFTNNYAIVYGSILAALTNWNLQNPEIFRTTKLQWYYGRLGVEDTPEIRKQIEVLETIGEKNESRT